MISLIRELRGMLGGTSNHKVVRPPTLSESIDYYERESTNYLNTYGDIIQAARPSSDELFLDYFVHSIDIKDGMRMLDAGCGVCGPAVHFARHLEVHIDAISASPSHVELSRANAANETLKGEIEVREGDFHSLNKIYQGNQYDVVYFLEALGYSSSLVRVLEGASKVLKPGGIIYIKDFFPVPLVKQEQVDVQIGLMREIRSEYCYRVLDLLGLLRVARDLGLLMVFAKRLDFVEDFTKASQFESISQDHNCYTKAINNPFQLFEPLELKFQKLPG